MVLYFAKKFAKLHGFYSSHPQIIASGCSANIVINAALG